MNVEQRAQTYAEWRDDLDLPGHVLYGIAYRGPGRDRHMTTMTTPSRVIVRAGWSDYLNSAAIRQLTQGEG